MEDLQPGAGLRAQVLREEIPHLSVHRKRLCLPPGFTEREHQHLPESFVQGMFGDQIEKLRGGLAEPAELVFHVDASLDCDEAQRLKAVALRHRVRSGNSGQRFSAPQVEGIAEMSYGSGVVSRSDGPLGHRNPLTEHT